MLVVGGSNWALQRTIGSGKYRNERTPDRVCFAAAGCRHAAELQGKG